MRLKIAAIDHELTGSELIALLKESEEIKLHKPVYNRAQKNSVFSHGLFIHEDQAGYKRFTIKKQLQTISLLLPSQAALMRKLCWSIGFLNISFVKKCAINTMT
ncbi:MAG: hypothetical protein IPG07_17360 [Crocinitomicaceae bacterium]|nr:hypothetical protein [Crocinitomicaceae bacterium]